MDIAHEGVVSGGEECVFITEHYPLYSAGKSFKETDFVATPVVQIYYPQRGGRVTVHSPGQLVIYPIINLRARNITISAYIRLLEGWILDVLSVFGIYHAQARSEVGVWVNEEKLGFIGVQVRNGITSHGLCLNISNDLSLFEAIIPCGLNNVKVTSMEKILGRRVALADVAKAFVDTNSRILR
ncbi:MAG: lipoyl(octanoyl) transferase LipB [Holosporales bacterium]|jgi:lipoyl(octanoyl) transferase|nr:lipoyl(octanoyl) transferase LipB [Holosporales bacterium]